MQSSLPLSVLLAPFVIALMAVAIMILFTGGRAGRLVRGPRPAGQELGYAVVGSDAVSLTPTRYVGGHPDRGMPLPSPYVLLTPRDLAVFARKNGALVFAVPWAKVEKIARLDAREMAMAAASVRGLAPGALEELAPDAAFVRVRYEDERGWWQNVVFELAGTYADDQHAALARAWRERQAEPAGEPQAEPGAGSSAEPPAESPPKA